MCYKVSSAPSLPLSLPLQLSQFVFTEEEEGRTKMLKRYFIIWNIEGMVNSALPAKLPVFSLTWNTS